MLFYEAYGLSIRCEFDLGIRQSHDREVEVVVEFVASLNRPLHFKVTTYNEGSVVSYSPNYTEFNWRDVGRVACINGNRIEIQRSSNFDKRTAAIGILSMALGVIIQQREVVNLHASAVEGPNGALVFAGDSGKGKSTALRFFLGCGMSFISDDVCRFDLCGESRILKVMGGVPLLKCFEDSLSLPLDSIEPMGPVHRGTDKNLFRVNQKYIRSESKVDSIFVLNWSDSSDESTKINTFNNLGAIENMLRYSYGMSIVKYYGVSIQYLKKLRDILKVSKVYSVEGKRNLEELHKLIADLT